MDIHYINIILYLFWVGFDIYFYFCGQCLQFVTLSFIISFSVTILACLLVKLSKLPNASPTYVLWIIIDCIITIISIGVSIKYSDGIFHIINECDKYVLYFMICSLLKFLLLVVSTTVYLRYYNTDYLPI